MNAKRFSGKRIVVTGAASGLGYATAFQLVQEGAQVIGLDRQVPSERIHGVEFYTVDVTNRAQVDECVNAVRADSGPFNAVAAFAGIECSGAIETVEDADWMRCFQVNLMGSVNVVRAVLDDLKRVRGGNILLCSTQLSISGGRNCIAYATSKGAINSFCKSLALDCAPFHIRVNAVAPGAIKTPMMDRVFSHTSPEAIEASRLRHPLGRFGTAQEVAKLACYLLSDEASFITGTVMPIDGGWTAA
ncbi:SDR family NAD(P)-dependent oxidoreductase [Ochrobactrum teleogrylli]